MDFSAKGETSQIRYGGLYASLSSVSDQVFILKARALTKAIELLMY